MTRRQCQLLAVVASALTILALSLAYLEVLS